MAGEGERRIPRFSSPAEIKQRLAAVSYLADEAVAMTVYLADRLEKPILCEGPAGVGKTALGKAIAAARSTDFADNAVYGREGITGVRPDGKIAVLAMRAGDAVGDHTVIFGGQGERLELIHRAQSRDSLARGAIRAAGWLVSQKPGLYTMRDVLGI